MDPTASALADLAAAAHDLVLDRLPDVVVRQAGLCILDTLGCIVAGTRTPEAALVLACEPGHGDGVASVFGSRERRDVDAAIRVNGYLGDVLELNDLIGGHASIGNVSAALALAEARGASGAALLEAVVRGIEVTSRLYNAVYPSLRRFTEVGLVPVGIPSAIGAAAAASHLLALDVPQTAQAMAIAGMLAGWCPAEAIFGDGGTAKPMLFGAQPGATGVVAARYAAAGMTGPLRLLESKLGWFATVATAPALDRGTWGDHYALLAPRRKLHACCGYLHALLDAGGELRARVGAAIDGGRIVARVPAYTADVVAKAALPVSPTDARFHLQFCLAVVLAGADLIEPGHSLDFAAELARPAVRDAMTRIEIVVDPVLTHYHQGRLAHTGAAGAVTDVAVDAPRGSPARPLGDAEVIAKFERLVAPVIGHGNATRVAARLPELAGLPSAGTWLADLAR